MEPMITVRRLTKVFDSGKTQVGALHDVSFSIDKGDIFGVIGMSGAGKSTLVRCLNLLEKPTEGEVFIGGDELTAMSKKQLRMKRRGIGMIFQQYNLLMQRTVLSNICFPMEIAGVPREERIRRAKEYLELVGLPEKAKAYPAELSGGQMQRVAIARVLASNPEVLLCDEATSALDPRTTRSILALLQEINLKYGITIVIITHEMRVVRDICKHVLVLDEGKVAELGEVETVFSSPSSTAAKHLISIETAKEAASYVDA